MAWNPDLRVTMPSSYAIAALSSKYASYGIVLQSIVRPPTADSSVKYFCDNNYSGRPKLLLSSDASVELRP